MRCLACWLHSQQSLPSAHAFSPGGPWDTGNPSGTILSSAVAREKHKTQKVCHWIQHGEDICQGQFWEQCGVRAGGSGCSGAPLCLCWICTPVAHSSHCLLHACLWLSINCCTSWFWGCKFTRTNPWVIIHTVGIRKALRIKTGLTILEGSWVTYT
jgi:hypothetical protein